MNAASFPGFQEVEQPLLRAVIDDPFCFPSLFHKDTPQQLYPTQISVSFSKYSGSKDLFREMTITLSLLCLRFLRLVGLHPKTKELPQDLLLPNLIWGESVSSSTGGLLFSEPEREISIVSLAKNPSLPARSVLGGKGSSPGPACKSMNARLSVPSVTFTTRRSHKKNVLIHLGFYLCHWGVPVFRHGRGLL